MTPVDRPGRLPPNGEKGSILGLVFDLPAEGSDLSANLMLLGTTGVPEPGSIVLLGLGLAGVGCYARGCRLE